MINLKLALPQCPPKPTIYLLGVTVCCMAVLQFRAGTSPQALLNCVSGTQRGETGPAAIHQKNNYSILNARVSELCRPLGVLCSPRGLRLRGCSQPRGERINTNYLSRNKNPKYVIEGIYLAGGLLSAIFRLILPTDVIFVIA